MRIIKYGDRKLKTKRFTCQFCGSIFDAEPNEYKTIFTGYLKHNTVNCPCCGLQVIQKAEEE